MKNFKFLLSLVCIFAFVSMSWALRGVPSTDEDIANLKKDLREGVVQITKTRLNQIRDSYGEATTIQDKDTRIIYDYGDVKLTLDKIKIWKSWEYDSFQKPVYTDSIDNLRFDLESQELVGEGITYDQIHKDYGDPTAMEETIEDGKLSYYYFGNIKMIFENVIVLSSWKGQLAEKVVAEPPAQMGASTGQ